MQHARAGGRRGQDESAFSRYGTKDLILAHMNAPAAGDIETPLAAHLEPMRVVEAPSTSKPSMPAPFEADMRQLGVGDLVRD